MSEYQPFIGSKEVILANGSKIPISSLGLACLTTDDCDLSLNNVLHAP